MLEVVLNIIEAIVLIAIYISISLFWYLKGWDDGFEYYRKELEKRKKKFL